MVRDCETRVDCVQLSFRAHHRGSRREPADHLPEGDVMIVRLQDRREPKFLNGVETRRHHANDGTRHAVERYRLAQHIAAALEVSAPEGIAQDRDLGGGGRLLFGPKAATELGLHTQRGEEVGGYLLAVNSYGIANTCAVPVPAVVGRKLLEGRGGGPAGDELGIGHRPAAERRWLLRHRPDRVQLGRFVIR